MVTRLVLKILFKATLPVVAVAGVMSYMMYLNGGDPKAVLAKVFGGMAGQARESMQQAGRSMDSLKPASEQSAISTVHTWVDANGVTHYSNTAPVNVESTTMRVNANANVVASTPTSKPAAKAVATAAGRDRGEQSSDNSSGFGIKKGQVIPGTGGVEMPVNLNKKDLTEFLENSQRPSAERFGLD